jgi:GABA(A) receptor-associated protein
MPNKKLKYKIQLKTFIKQYKYKYLYYLSYKYNMTELMKFRYKKSYKDRCEESTKCIKEYPDRVPVICEPSTKKCPTIDKVKYLVPRNLSICQFLYVIRGRMSIKPDEALFLFINGNTVNLSNKLGNIYEIYKNVDGFLYTSYASENTFGS